MFGDTDVVMRRRHLFTLKCNRAGSTIYKLKASHFLKYMGSYKESYKQVVRSVLDQDMVNMKQLGIVAYKNWS